jgi:hypothetical protein
VEEAFDMDRETTYFWACFPVSDNSGKGIVLVKSGNPGDKRGEKCQMVSANAYSSYILN